MAGLYIHIPFCASKCIYCDFYSMPGHLDEASRYVSALVAEARLRRSELHEPVTTLYVGGGTPSLLSLDWVGALVSGLSRVFDLSGVEEFTVEVNPDDVTAAYIAGLKALGVNRVSMGVQSFNDAELRLINRRHTARQAVDAVHAIHAAGIHNISIDLIYGIPGQSLASWRKSVRQAVALGVQHISAYSLMYEPGTRLWVMREQGKVTEVDDDTVVAMYQALCQLLHRAGYCHYEISNFALPGYYSRHNSSYWDLTPYLGLGAAAHSYDGQLRRHNPARLKSYLDSIEAGKCCFEAEQEQPWERYDEYVMLRLRTAAGLDLGLLRQRFGTAFASYFHSHAAPLLGSSLCLDDGRYHIPEDHVMMTDAITRDLLWDQD